MPDIQIRPITESDRSWVKTVSLESWGAETVIAHGEVFYPAKLEGFIAYTGEEKVGLLTYQVIDKACEIVTLNSIKPKMGIGSALIHHIAEYARQIGCDKLWLITTNDNTGALYFYQKLGFRLAALRTNVMPEYRKLKPEIPMISDEGIPIRDEIELEMDL